MSKSRNYVPDEKKLHPVKKFKNSRTKYLDIDYNDDIDESVDSEDQINVDEQSPTSV